MSDPLSIQRNDFEWTAYYDPEGLTGHGATSQGAVEDLLEKTEEARCEALDQRDAARKELRLSQGVDVEYLESVRAAMGRLVMKWSLVGLSADEVVDMAIERGEYAVHLRGLVDSAVKVLQRHITPPDNISDHDALSEMYGIFDGPAYRAALATEAGEQRIPTLPAIVEAEASVVRTSEASGPVGLGPCTHPVSHGAGHAMFQFCGVCKMERRRSESGLWSEWFSATPSAEGLTFPAHPVIPRQDAEFTAEGFIIKKPQSREPISATNPLTPGCYCEPGRCCAPKPEWCRDAVKRDFSTPTKGSF